MNGGTRGLLYGSNFSIGMQIMYKLADDLAKLARDYTITMSETHHAEKKDAPSGTALSLRQVLENANPSHHVEIVSHREGDSLGTHVITARSGDDLIEIKHEALSRRAFAEGAVRAAEWLAGKTGCFEFKEIYPQLG